VTVSLTTNNNTLQVPPTLADVAQVEDLFYSIVKGEPQLDPVIYARLKKLLKGATKAIANAKIQHSTNAELVSAKETQKRRGKRFRKNYGFA
jgi:hypothetical protein